MNENESRETIADIVAEMCDHVVSANAWKAGIKSGVVMDFADRIEAAVDRERRQYEKLHECFWDKRAVQCIIRRMLDSRDDLARAYPETARELDYYAGELIRARCECAAGNAAAMRDALVAVKKSIDGIGESSLDCDPTILMAALTQVCARLSARIERALSAPPRNCDVGTADEQDARFSKFCVEKSSGSCSGCPDAVGGFTVANGIRECALVWSQTPYAAKEGGAS